MTEAPSRVAITSTLCFRPFARIADTRLLGKRVAGASKRRKHHLLEHSPGRRLAALRPLRHHRFHLAGRRAIARARDPPRGIEVAHAVAKLLVELRDTFRGLIHEDHRAAMPCEPPGRAHLVIPGESALRVVREIHVVRRISIDEIRSLEWNRFKVAHGEIPGPKHRAIAREVPRIRDLLVRAERHVEPAGSVEAAQAVVAGSIQKVEQARRFGALALPCCQQLVEALPVLVEQRLIVLERYCDLQAAAKPGVERDQVRVDIVQKRPGRREPEHHGETATERLDEPPAGVRFPERFEMWKLPALPAGPLQRR